MKGLLLQSIKLPLSLILQDKNGRREKYNNTNEANCNTDYSIIFTDDSSAAEECYRNLLSQRVNAKDGHTMSLWYAYNRQHCVSFINKLCERFHLKGNAYFSALSYCDKIMKNLTQLTKKEFDLKIIGCFLLAAKYAENDAYELDISGVRSYDLSISYDRKSVKEYEIRCLKELDYNLNPPTISDVLTLQIACGVLFKDEGFDINLINDFISFTQNHLKKLTASNMIIRYEEEVLTLCLILFGRNYLNLPYNRLRCIMGKLDFTDETGFELCFKDMKEFFSRNTRKGSDTQIRNSYFKIKAGNKTKSTTIKSISNKVSNKRMRNTMKYQPTNKLALTILTSWTNRTKCSNTSCSTKQDSSSTLINVNLHQGKQILIKKTRSSSTNPNLCLKNKPKINSTIISKLPLIDIADWSSENTQKLCSLRKVVIRDYN